MLSALGHRLVQLGVPLALLAGGACASVGSGPGSDGGDSVSSELPLDSLTLERIPGFFERRGPGEEPAIPGPGGYLLRVARDGSVTFRRERTPDSIAEGRVEADIAAQLLERADELGLDGLPTELMGEAPYCRIVATDFPATIITLYAPDGVHRVRHYKGCFPENDHSEEQVIVQLREFEEALLEAVGAERWLEDGRAP